MVHEQSRAQAQFEGRKRAAILGVAMLLLLGCSPPLKVTVRDDCAVVDVQRMGEYYSVITDVTLKNENNEMIWRAEAKPGVRPKLAFVKLCLGTNPAAPEIWGDSDKFRYEVAHGASSFELDEGIEYTIEVHGSDAPRAARRSFSF